MQADDEEVTAILGRFNDKWTDFGQDIGDMNTAWDKCESVYARLKDVSIYLEQSQETEGRINALESRADYIKSRMKEAVKTKKDALKQNQELDPTDQTANDIRTLDQFKGAE